MPSPPFPIPDREKVPSGREKVHTFSARDALVRLLERRGMKRGAGIGIVFGAFAILAALFFVFLLPPILSQVGAFVRNLPEAIAGVVDSDWFLALSPDLKDAVAAGLDEVAVALAQPETIAARQDRKV